MNITKNDLSFNSTKLDYKALVQTARIAYGQLLYTIFREYSLLQETQDNAKRWLEAGYLKSHSAQLAIVAETLSTLLEAESREELIVVNKPEIPKGA